MHAIAACPVDPTKSIGLQWVLGPSVNQLSWLLLTELASFVSLTSPQYLNLTFHNEYQGPEGFRKALEVSRWGVCISAGPSLQIIAS